MYCYYVHDSPEKQPCGTQWTAFCVNLPLILSHPSGAVDHLVSKALLLATRTERALVALAVRALVVIIIVTTHTGRGETGVIFGLARRRKSVVFAARGTEAGVGVGSAVVGALVAVRGAVAVVGRTKAGVLIAKVAAILLAALAAAKVRFHVGRARSVIAVAIIVGRVLIAHASGASIIHVAGAVVGVIVAIGIHSDSGFLVRVFWRGRNDAGLLLEGRGRELWKHEV